MVDDPFATIAMFCGRAVGVSGDLDALEALSKIKESMRLKDNALVDIQNQALVADPSWILARAQQGRNA